MSEPIQDGGEANEAEDGLGELVVMRGDTAVDFNSAEEVLDLMAAPVVTAMESGWLATAASGRDATTATLGSQAGTGNISVKAIVCHDPTVPGVGQHGRNCMLVMLRSGREAEGHRPPAGISEGREFGIQTALPETHRLSGLIATRIGSMLMELDVRTIQVPQFADGILGQDRQHSSEQAVGTPASVAGVDRWPWSITLGQNRAMAPRFAARR